MKTRLILFILLFISGFAIAGCKQQNQYRPDAKIVAAFNNKYPQADKVEWEQKQGYYVAEFREDGIEHEAWFDGTGKWVMTESNLRYSSLPQAIREQFEKSVYSTWKKDDIDKIERAGMEAVYIIELEKEGLDTDLYYVGNGNLIKTVNEVSKEKRSSYMPVASDIQTWIKQKYLDATIIEMDNEKGKLEVDILDGGKAKELIFQGNDWLSTSWEVSKAEVPSVVMETFRHSNFGNTASSICRPCLLPFYGLNRNWLRILYDLIHPAVFNLDHPVCHWRNCRIMCDQNHRHSTVPAGIL